MNTNRNRIIRTNKTTTTVIVGAITLALGLVIGVTATVSHNAVNSRSSKNAPDNVASASNGNSQLSGSVNTWNPFQQMRQMQSQMDRMFNQMTRQFQSEPGFNSFADIPGYSLSLDVRDMKDHYEVHAYLPDAKASNVHVTLKNNQTLKVEVNSQHTVNSNSTTSNTNALTNVAEWGQYEQTVQLPTPVKAGQMKIKRNGHELIITIPKK